MTTKQPLPSLAKMLSTMNRIYSQHMSAEIQPFNMNMTHIAIILGLDSTPGVSLNSFAIEKKINKAILSKAIKKLQESGLVILKPDSEHKQRYKIYLSQKSQAIVPKLRTFISAYEEKALTNLSAQEKNTLLTLLNKVYAQEIDS